jgi:hypothetical protein
MENSTSGRAHTISELVFLCLLFLSAIVFLGGCQSSANIDLQADMDKIVVGIKKFDANSAKSSSVASFSEARALFSRNADILAEIESAVASYKSHLETVRDDIPTQDTEETPKFTTLMNIAKGYENWLRYQKINQNLGENCLEKTDESLPNFVNCTIDLLEVSLQNERLGMTDLQTAWQAWKDWQERYGHI